MTALRIFRLFLSVLILVPVLLPVHASDTVVTITPIVKLVDKRFSYSSEQGDPLGPWKIWGSESADGIQSMQVFAFGRTAQLPADQLAKLQHVRVKATIFTTEDSRKSKGGRAVCLTFELEDQPRKLKFSFNEKGQTKVDEL
jgi:hypothetical protein